MEKFYNPVTDINKKNNDLFVILTVERETNNRFNVPDASPLISDSKDV